MKAKSSSLLKSIQLMLSVLLIIGSAKAQLKADFTSDIKAGCSPIIVNFKDSSSGNPTSWKWDLGNGTISFLQNPAVSYIIPGTYTVKLYVKKASQEDSMVKLQYITVYANPDVNFTALTTQGCYPLKVQFSDLSQANSGTLSQWQWDFGDGNISSLQNPLHTYTAQGDYDVKLKITNSHGCTKTIGKNDFIKVSGGLHADFTNVVSGSCTPPNPVTFTNASTGTGTLSYEWWFGDGVSSTDVSPVHIYSAPGSYTVTLIAKNSYGCTDTVVRTNGINIGTVKAKFNVPDSICLGTTLNITNASIPATVSSNWTFGDGSFSTQINPVYTYHAPGNYTIKLVNNFGLCIDSTSKNITVLDKPTASFTAVDSTACAAPLNVQFINNSMGGVSYQWNFGNGNTSTLQTPTHSFTSSGNYNVSLLVIAANGCKDSITTNSFITISGPKVTSIDYTPKEGCVPLSVDVNAYITSVQTINNYEWNFGDGFISTATSPNHIYTSEGTFSLQVVITTTGGCTDTLKINDAIKIGHKPNADFVGSPNTVCPSIPVQFTDQSTNGPIDRWKWWFGDGKGSDVQNPSNNYSDTGYRTVKFAVWNNGCSDTIVKPRYIFVNPPIARFVYNVNDCSNGLKVNFIDSSILPITYLWDFGDGTTSTLSNPVHIYAAAGTYTVILTVYNNGCSHSKVRQVQVDGKKGILKVLPEIICRNNYVAFSIDSTNTAVPASYKWNIGTGTVIPTSLPNLQYSYTQTGSYPVYVVVEYVNGCIDTLVSPQGVKVYGPVAGFKSLDQQFCSGNLINFTDTSLTDGIHPINNWTWNYGDGNIVSYNTAPFSHHYTTGGTFGVMLKVTDTYGCADSVFKPNAVIVSKSVSAFIESDTLICPGTSVQFTSQSTGNNLVHNWDLGDGTLNSTLNPLHVYPNPGTYTIKLSVIDPLGCADTLIKVNRIQVYNPVASFSLSDSTAVCPPLLVNMTNNSLHAGTSTWTFGDGSNASIINPSHLYTYPGNYSVKLIVSNTGGCADSLVKHVFINGPTGTFNYSPLIGCVPLKVNFSAQTQNTVKNMWDFSDGVVNSSTINSSLHNYTLGGDYIPKLILEDAQGCRVSIIGKDTVKVKEVKAFMASPYRNVCDSATILFSDSTQTNDIITKYNWKFGDGSTSVQQQPSHLYNTNGLFSVKLTVTTLAGCKDSVTYTQAIKVVSTPKAVVLGDTAVCKNGSLLFTANRINADTSAVTWYWNFGNGGTSSLQNPPAQTYTAAGTFSLINKITNSTGCTGTITKNIIVHDLPNVNAGADAAICRNQTYNLTATGANSYTWSANGSSLSCTNCASPVAKPLTTITYAVTGKNAYNCIATDSVTITVQQPLKLSVPNADTLCLGNTANIKASGTEKYTWYPSLYVDNPNNAEVNIHPAKDTLINYMVIGKDNRGCFADTGYVKVKTYPIPKFEIDQDEITVNAGTNLQIKTNNSADITKWRWLPTRYLDNPNISQPSLIARESITYTCTASNDGNCVAKDEVKVIVVCNGGNIFVPNTFSPNGDGRNDIFYPRGKGVFAIKSFRVFNRWGELIFERNNFQVNDVNAGWDGTYKGAKLPSGAYVYSVEIMCDNSTSIPAKGSITLLR